MINFIPEEYVPSQEFQMSGTIYAETKDGVRMTLQQAKTTKTPIKKLYLQPIGGFLYNTTYTVVAEESIQSITGKSMKQKYVMNFTGSYGPLYSTPLEVHSVIKGLYEYFTMHDIYVALRDAGQKAHILLKYYPDINSSRFRPVLEVRLEYFPMTKVIVYEAAKSLLGSLYVKLSQKMNIGDPNTPLANESSLKLGDFTVTEKTDPKILGAGLLEIIRSTITQVDKDLKYWTDNLMNRNRRGYANPISAQMRSKTGATPVDRGF